MSAETYVVSGGRPAHEHDAPVNPPIILSSTYRGAGTVDTVSDKVYARFANPTWEAMEEVVAGLEGGTHGLLFPSGMAAIASILDLVPVGSVILIPKHAYMASITMSKDLQKRGIAEVVRIDLEDTDSVIAAFEDAAARTGVTPETVEYSAPKVLAWLESPTNPMLEVADLPAICAAAKRLGVVTAVDNTFATQFCRSLSPSVLTWWFTLRPSSWRGIRMCSWALRSPQTRTYIRQCCTIASPTGLFPDPWRRGSAYAVCEPWRFA